MNGRESDTMNPSPEEDVVIVHPKGSEWRKTSEEKERLERAREQYARAVGQGPVTTLIKCPPDSVGDLEIPLEIYRR